MTAPLVSTGVPGLDHILRGGLPEGRFYLITGDPGVGKTTLAIQFLLEGARRGEAALYITLSESRAEVDSVAQSHGWPMEGISVFEVSELQSGQAVDEGDNYVFHPDEVELSEVMGTLLKELERVQPRRVVLDSLSELRLLAQGPLRYRRQIQRLKQYFASRNCTALLLDDRSAGRDDQHFQSVCHGVIDLKLTSPEYGAARRRLQVVKVRGLDFRSGYHDFAMRKGGLVVFPRLIALEHAEPFQQQQIKSGLPELDKLLGGGIHRGRCILLAGAAGLGKSTLAAQFLAHGSTQGIRARWFLFDERPETMLMRARLLSIDLSGPIKRGMIKLQQVDPAEMSIGEFTGAVMKAVEEDGARFVVIDSMSGFLHAMRDEKAMMLQLHEMLTYLGQRGVTTFLVIGQPGIIGSPNDASVDVSYLCDVIILLRYFEGGGSIRKAISVVKQRTGLPETTIREFVTDKRGIRIGKPLKGFHGMLRLTPSFTGGGGQLLQKKHKARNES